MIKIIAAILALMNWNYGCCLSGCGADFASISSTNYTKLQVSIDKPTKRASIETDAVRPKDEKEVNLLKKKDPYGHYKLSGEEALKHYQRNKGGFPWVILRLADVIGPRDTTNR